jgi:hypothetical protein
MLGKYAGPIRTAVPIGYWFAPIANKPPMPTNINPALKSLMLRIFNAI